MFVRDEYTCQYCGDKLGKKSCTVDHIIPKSQGGKNKWENTVTCCFDCNNKKDRHLPSECGMVLLKKPLTPTIMSFILLKIKSEGLEGILKELGIY